MTRPLERLEARPDLVLAGLRGALGGSGSAIFVGDTSERLPAEVARRIALVVETSGSTARPKRVALSADALLASAAASASAIGGDGQWLLALPTHYIAGINVLVRSIASGTEPVILRDGSFDPVAFARAAETMDADLRFTAVVPAQLSRLLDTPDALQTLRRFDRILVGGQSTPQALVDRAGQLGIAITRTYGSSETSGGCVYDGAPIGNTRARVSDGQLELAGAVLAEGYLDDDERTASTFVDDEGTRWYRTGDTGEVLDGRVRVFGRLDDVIISGGVKVSLADVQAVVRGIPDQEDAVVVRAPSERWGEVPVVVTTQAIELAVVRDRVRAELPPAAAPDRVVLVSGIPLLPSGKPDRVGLQRLAQ
ncbi:MAG TPA: AMP-binding protein [Galbitalea sp.]|jgi:O-succinylbenzoic acid--CoA ligase|nr:AMP-binding protein [Galbitalea sp.]